MADEKSQDEAFSQPLSMIAGSQQLSKVSSDLIEQLKNLQSPC